MPNHPFACRTAELALLARHAPVPRRRLAVVGLSHAQLAFTLQHDPTIA